MILKLLVLFGIKKTKEVIHDSKRKWRISESSGLYYAEYTDNLTEQDWRTWTYFGTKERAVAAIEEYISRHDTPSEKPNVIWESK